MWGNIPKSTLHIATWATLLVTEQNKSAWLSLCPRAPNTNLTVQRLRYVCTVPRHIIWTKAAKERLTRFSIIEAVVSWYAFASTNPASRLRLRAKNKTNSTTNSMSADQTPCRVCPHQRVHPGQRARPIPVGVHQPPRHSVAIRRQDLRAQQTILRVISISCPPAPVTLVRVAPTARG